MPDREWTHELLRQLATRLREQGVGSFEEIQLGPFFYKITFSSNARLDSMDKWKIEKREKGLWVPMEWWERNRLRNKGGIHQGTNPIIAETPENIAFFDVSTAAARQREKVEAATAPTGEIKEAIRVFVAQWGAEGTSKIFKWEGELYRITLTHAAGQRGRPLFMRWWKVEKHVGGDTPWRTVGKNQGNQRGELPDISGDIGPAAEFETPEERAAVVTAETAGAEADFETQLVVALEGLKVGETQLFTPVVNGKSYEAERTADGFKVGVYSHAERGIIGTRKIKGKAEDVLGDLPTLAPEEQAALDVVEPPGAAIPGVTTEPTGPPSAALTGVPEGVQEAREDVAELRQLVEIAKERGDEQSAAIFQKALDYITEFLLPVLLGEDRAAASGAAAQITGRLNTLRQLKITLEPTEDKPTGVPTKIEYIDGIPWWRIEDPETGEFLGYREAPRIPTEAEEAETQATRAREIKQGELDRAERERKQQLNLISSLISQASGMSGAGQAAFLDVLESQGFSIRSLLEGFPIPTPPPLAAVSRPLQPTAPGQGAPFTQAGFTPMPPGDSFQEAGTGLGLRAAQIAAQPTAAEPDLGRLADSSVIAAAEAAGLTPFQWMVREFGEEQALKMIEAAKAGPFGPTATPVPTAATTFDTAATAAQDSANVGSVTYTAPDGTKTTVNSPAAGQGGPGTGGLGLPFPGGTTQPRPPAAATQKFGRIEGKGPIVRLPGTYTAQKWDYGV